MKKLILIFALLALASGAFAADVAKPGQSKGRQLINLKMKDTVLPFQHWKHQALLKQECWHCHTKEIGKIEGWSKETAHKICIACHELEEKGPTTCRQCHPKPKK